MFGRIDNFKPDIIIQDFSDLLPTSNIFLDAVGDGIVEYCTVDYIASETMIPDKAYPANGIPIKWTPNKTY
jgi:hypothetical protein